MASYGLKHNKIILQISGTGKFEKPTQICWFYISLNEVLAENCGDWQKEVVWFDSAVPLKKRSKQVA